MGSNSQLIHEIFEAQVARAPEAVALRCEGLGMTYLRLNRKANQLARHLRARGVGPDRLVGLCVERHVEMVVGMLAILKAGGAYLPLDPAYPTQRLGFMIQDAQPPIILTQSHLSGAPFLVGRDVIALDAHNDDLTQQDDTNLDSAGIGLTSRSLAYVIYTSGSTGVPKGAMNEHRGMVNRICAQQHIEQFATDDVCCQKTSISFVDAVFEIFGALCNGIPLVIIPAGSVKDSRSMAALIAKHQVTQLTTVPSLARSMLEITKVMNDLSRLRTWTLSGEEVRPDLLLRLHDALPRCEFIILYGASEISSDAATHRTVSVQGERVPIGRPVPNGQVYILDDQGHPVSDGAIGEIHVGGVGVGRGYLNRPELTAERFMPDPYSCDPQARLYKTGDLGRWRPDGLLECFGRVDHQIKIRGFRIELGEIETQLRTHPRIEQVAVTAHDDESGAKYLAAYWTPRDPTVTAPLPETHELRTHLSCRLPDYMLPSAWIRLDSLPLTPNGKLDRRALPAPTAAAFTTRPYEAPQGKVEEHLAEIWRTLLPVERVGRQDNFFELGGHSLLLVQMLERLAERGLVGESRGVLEAQTLAELARVLIESHTDSVPVPPNRIPAGARLITPSMLPLLVLAPEDIDYIVQAVPQGAANVQDIYPLAPLQKGILFHHLLSGEHGDAYVIPTLLAVSSRARLDELITALQKIIERHDILRSAILWENLPQPVQVVCRHAVLPVEEILPSLLADREKPLHEELLKPGRQRLPLTRAPLMRLTVAKAPDGIQYYALLQLHHIACDHLAHEHVLHEIVMLLNGTPERLPNPLPFRDHVAHALVNEKTRDSNTYFQERLADIDEPTAPFGISDVHGDGSQIEEATEKLTGDLHERLRSQARRRGVTVATLLHAAWALVIAHTTGRADVVYGTVLLGRLSGSARSRQVLGLFINTLPLRLRLHHVAADTLVEQTHRELIELLLHEQSTLAEAQRASGIPSSTPLFTTLLNYRRYEHADADRSAAPGINMLVTRERTNYPITLSVDDRDDMLTLTAQTDRRIDSRRLVQYLVTALESLTVALERSPGQPALSLQVLPSSELFQVLHSFNNTNRPYTTGRRVHQLFEDQAARTPQGTALIHNDRSMTYHDLNTRADELAQHLAIEGVAPGHIVAVCLERGFAMVVGVLAILKAGASYLPLDPSHPPERLQQMLADASPHRVLTHASLESVLPLSPAKITTLEAIREVITPTTQAPPAANRGLKEPDLVYVIYTSGSTGRPKGTAMPHRSMTNLIEWHRHCFGGGEGVRTLQFAALSFDVAFQEIFSTLCTGGTLVLLDERVRKDPRELTELLVHHSVERLFLPPLMLQSLAEYCASTKKACTTLRDVIVAGEQLRVSTQIRRFFTLAGGARLHNHYGPTETHVVTALTLSGEPAAWPVLPTIGAPIANTVIYVLNTQRQPVPIGVPGEIYIGGKQLAQGYLNRPDLTEERFIPNLFSSEVGTRLYKTGDLGRWRSDGTLEYLGRNDDQVKLRGYRIELGEIEAQLARHAQVKEAAVIAREISPGNKRLIAYFTSPGDVTPPAAHLRAHLETVLPDFMVPSAFVQLSELPLTASGKLNRRALPTPQTDAYPMRNYTAPQGDVEQTLATLWQDLLRIPRVGREDHFFALGGHSLLAMQLIVRIRALLSLEVPLEQLFKFPTVRTLAAAIESLRQQALLQEIAAGGDDMAELLERVAAMPESQAEELVRTLTLGGAV